MEAIKILIVDDHEVVRDGLVVMLGRQEGFSVVGEAKNGLEAVEKSRELRPDVILMDLRMPELNGVEAMRHIRNEQPEVGFLVLTTFDTDEYIFDAIEAGAKGYLLKDTSREELFHAVRAVRQGESVIEPGVAAKVLDRLAKLSRQANQPAAIDILSESEIPDGTVTILFSDIVGSTTMTARLGDQQMQDVLHAHNSLVRQEVAAHGGFEVKSMGDGFMLAFSSARRALRCAIAIQRAFTTYNAEQLEEPIRVRIGLHTGEAIKEAEDFYGKNVILASRIANEAQGGEILVSALLKDLTESGGDIKFGEGQEVELKGLPGTNRVYRVMWE